MKTNLKKLLGTIALSSVMGISSGCTEKYKTGTVVKEAGSIVVAQQTIESKNCACFKDKYSEKWPTYFLQIQTSEGIYTASIEPTYERPLEALALAIEEGTKVKFSTGLIQSDKVGTIYADELKILE